MRRKQKLPPKHGIIDVLNLFVHISSVRILVMLKNGDKKFLQEYHVKSDRLYNLYWVGSMNRREKECILFKDIKELILAGV